MSRNSKLDILSEIVSDLHSLDSDSANLDWAVHDSQDNQMESQEFIRELNGNMNNQQQDQQGNGNQNSPFRAFASVSNSQLWIPSGITITAINNIPSVSASSSTATTTSNIPTDKRPATSPSSQLKKKSKKSAATTTTATTSSSSSSVNSPTASTSSSSGGQSSSTRLTELQAQLDNLKRVLLTKYDHHNRIEDRVYSPDKHCGVLEELGHPCKRAFSCSKHKIVDKKNVPGRSKSLKELIDEKQNIVDTIRVVELNIRPYFHGSNANVNASSSSVHHHNQVGPNILQKQQNQIRMQQQNNPLPALSTSPSSTPSPTQRQQYQQQRVPNQQIQNLMASRLISNGVAPASYQNSSTGHRSLAHLPTQQNIQAARAQQQQQQWNQSVYQSNLMQYLQQKQQIEQQQQQFMAQQNYRRQQQQQQQSFPVFTQTGNGSQYLMQHHHDAPRILKHVPQTPPPTPSPGTADNFPSSTTTTTTGNSNMDMTSSANSSTQSHQQQQPGQEGSPNAPLQIDLEKEFELFESSQE